MTVPVVDLSGLILLKLYAGGSQDAWDIRQLLETSEGSRSIAGVEGTLPELPPEPTDLWRRLEAG